MWHLVVWYTLIAMTHAHGTFKEPGRADYYTPDKQVCLLWQQDAVNISNQVGPGFIVVQPCKHE